jgi:redox-sensing transcriptional repressor
MLLWGHAGYDQCLRQVNIPVTFPDLATHRYCSSFLVTNGLILNTPQQDTEVPKVVVGRMSLYLRELQIVSGAGKATISSSTLARRLGLTASQVRKDFAYFGQFGYPGIGYRCDELIQKIKSILGTDRVWPVALIGCGNLGQALLGYRGFGNQGFSVVAAFDKQPGLIGKSFEGLTVQHMDELAETVSVKKIELAMLAVPATAAPEAAQEIVEAGIAGIMNFAPVTLSLPSSVSKVGVDLAIELEQLAFGVMARQRSRGRSAQE